MEDQYYDIERRTAIKEEARMFRRKFRQKVRSRTLQLIIISARCWKSALVKELPTTIQWPLAR